jgi:hypothetical protein
MSTPLGSATSLPAALADDRACGDGPVRDRGAGERVPRVSLTPFYDPAGLRVGDRPAVAL